MAWRDFGLLLALGCIWGASFLFIKVIVQEMSPFTLPAFRLALGSLGLIALLGLRDPRSFLAMLRVLFERRWAFTVLTLFGAVFPYVCISWGQYYIASGTGAILNATSPLFSALLAFLLTLGGHEERLSRERVAGLALGFVGVVVLVGNREPVESGLMPLLGYIAVLVGSLFYAVSAHYARTAFAGTAPIVTAVGLTLLGAVLSTPVAMVGGLPPAPLSPAALGSLLAIGFLGTSVAYLIYYRLVARIGATGALSVTYIQPATALSYGAVLLGESITLAKVAGLVLILGGVALTAGAVRLRRAEVAR